MASLRVRAGLDRRPSASTEPRRNTSFRYTITTDICPQVVLRILGLFAQRDLIPRSIGVERGPRRLRVEAMLDDIPELAATILLHRIAGIVGVRTVRLGRRRG